MMLRRERSGRSCCVIKVSKVAPVKAGQNLG